LFAVTRSLSKIFFNKLALDHIHRQRSFIKQITSLGRGMQQRSSREKVPQFLLKVASQFCQM
jgi:hypothetical protein